MILSIYNISADNFNVTAERFSNYKATINANDFNVTAVNLFNNWFLSTINADSFSISISGDNGNFWNRNNATINADNFSVSLSGSISVYGNFWNDGATIKDNFSVSLSGDNVNFWNDGATINAD